MFGSSINCRNATLRQQLDTASIHSSDDSTARPPSLSNPADNSTNATSSDTTCTPSKSTLVPTSNCTAMGGTYITAWTHSIFETECETDYRGSDVLGIWAFTFADCMEACASWNGHGITPRCYTVSYDIRNSGNFTENSGVGNCFFKASDNVQPRGQDTTSSGTMKFKQSG